MWGRVTDEEGIIFPNLQKQVLRGRQACSELFGIPGVGTLYQKQWHRDPWIALMVLPTGDLEEVGLSGQLSDTALLKQKDKPQCFTYSDDRITGWAQGYEDGGPSVDKRSLPCLYFNDSFHVPPAETNLNVSDIPDKYLIRWVPSETIIPLDLDGRRGRIFGLESARKFKARLDVIKERRALSSRRAESMHDDSLDPEKVSFVMEGCML